MKTHYFNAFHGKDNKFWIEGNALTYDEALEDIADTSHYYAYTLEVSLEETKRIDLEGLAFNRATPTHECLTHSQTGVSAGRDF